MANDNKTVIEIVADATGMRTGSAQAAEINKSTTNQIKADWAGTSSTVTSSITSMGTGIKSTITGIMSSFSGLQSSILGVSAILGGGALFSSAIKSTTGYYGEIKRLSTALGVTTQEASGVAVALRKVGLTTDDYLTASSAISKQLASNGKGFENLGIQTLDANGKFRNSKDILIDVANVLKNTEAGTSRNVAAVEIFKKAQIDITKFTKLSGDAFIEASKKAEQLGLSVGPEQMANFGAYAQAQRDLKLASEALSVNIGSVVLPVLAKFGTTVVSIPSMIDGATKSVNDWSSSHQELIGITTSVIESIGTLGAVWAVNKVGVMASAAATTVWTGVTTISTAIMNAGSISTGIATVATNLFSASCLKAAAAELAMIAPMELLIGSIVIVGVAGAALAAGWYTNFNGMKDATAGTVNAIGASFSNLWEHLKNIANGIFQVLKGALALDPAAIQSGIGAVKSGWAGAMTDIGSIAGNTWKGVGTAGVLAFEGVKNSAKGVMSSLGFGGGSEVPTGAGGGNQLSPGDVDGGKKGGGDKGQSPYELAKKAYEKDLALHDYTLAQKLEKYKAYLEAINKDEDENLDYLKGKKQQELEVDKANLEKQKAFLDLADAEHRKSSESGMQSRMENAKKETALIISKYGEDSKEYAEAKIKEVKLAQQISDQKYQIEKDLLNKRAQLLEDEKDLEIEGIKFKYELGQISQTDQIAQLNKLEAAKRQIKLDEMKADRDFIGANKGIDSNEYKKQLTAIELYESQMKLAATKASNQLSTVLQKPWTDLKKSIQDSLASSLSSVLNGTASIKTAFQGLANSVLKSYTDMWSKQLVQQLFTGKQQTAQEQTKQGALTSIQTAGDTARAASAKVSNAAQQAMGATAAIAIVGQTSAAFTGILGMITAMAASIATIVPVGPAMAAAMMGGVGASAGMLAGASATATAGISASMALPSYDVGSWSLPNDGPIMAHKDEVVVPAKGGFADAFRNGTLFQQPQNNQPQQRQQGNIVMNVNATALDGMGVGRVIGNAGRHVAQGLQKVNRTLSMPNQSRWGRV